MNSCRLVMQTGFIKGNNAQLEIKSKNVKHAVGFAQQQLLIKRMAIENNIIKPVEFNPFIKVILYMEEFWVSIVKPQQYCQ